MTKLRWVVEGRNGQLETFKALGQAVNNSLSHLMDDYKIAAALINCFYTILESDKDSSVEIVKGMQKKLNHTSNNLDKYLIDFKKLKFEKINGHSIIDFPRFSIEKIKTSITFGSFQLKSSLSYLAEHLKKNGNYAIYVSENEYRNNGKKILMAKIQSRHINRIEYQIVIEYVPHSTNADDVSWRCTCKNGKRTMGCCSHITCIIYFLSYGKYQNELKQPGVSLNDILKCLNESDTDTDQNDDDNIDVIIDKNNDCKVESTDRIKPSRILSSYSFTGNAEKKLRSIDHSVLELE